MSCLDSSISFICLFLFIYPLHKLLQHQTDKEIKNQLYNVMIKYSILYSTAICSSFSFVISCYFLPFGYNYAMIDGLINGMMLILLHPLHNACYKRICGVMHKCCINGCNLLLIHQEQKQK